MLWRVIEAEVVPASTEAGLSQIVWSPLAQGVLTGKYLPGQPLPPDTRATDDKGGADFIQRFLRDEVLDRVQRLRPLARDAGLTMAQMGLAWVLQHDFVASAIVGASRPEQLVDNVAALGTVLDEDLLAAIDAELDGVIVRDPALTRSPESRP
jgi:aryl-alcohol dehydrogenase-like predicted oxidoreductase